MREIDTQTEKKSRIYLLIEILPRSRGRIVPFWLKSFLSHTTLKKVILSYVIFKYHKLILQSHLPGTNELNGAELGSFRWVWLDFHCPILNSPRDIICINELGFQSAPTWANADIFSIEHWHHIQCNLKRKTFECVVCNMFSTASVIGCNRTGGKTFVTSGYFGKPLDSLSRPSMQFPCAAQTVGIYITMNNKYSLLMHCIKIKSPAKSLLNEQYVIVGGNIYFLCVLSCSSEEA